MRQPYKMVKYTQTIPRQWPTNCWVCLTIFLTSMKLLCDKFLLLQFPRIFTFAIVDVASADFDTFQITASDNLDPALQ